MISARVVYQELRSFITSSYILKISVNPFCSSSIGGGGGEEEHVYSDVPRPGKKWERKPYPTPMKTLIRRAKSQKQLQKENPCRIIEKAPDNGLLVPELVDVAQHVYLARDSLLRGLSLLFHFHADTICVHRCRFCREVHIGQTGHEIKTCEGSKGASRNALHTWRRGGIRDIIYFPKCYHIYDRAMNPRVGHKERFETPRLPAVVELCIQAGLDLQNYPTKRRSKPVYSIEGRVVDFDPTEDDDGQSFITIADNNNTIMFSEEDSMSELATKTLQSYLEMKIGVEEMMKEYITWTCGYCTTVQVGPKGHKVRGCKATAHQYRDGLHAWQEATVDDLIGPNYVWHVSSSRPRRSPLELKNELKRFYGKAPAVVELCVQMGAPVPPQYMSMMRLDVVSPSLDEYDLVA
ncbi:APO protein 3, mitochondrial [Zostera marina]|uniref:APO protein 3, mitochondrial n=1 Tax=Zostera marina TaxID=29655 RepID=A0A0K9NM24_ZOSMR|nr:APO protein 3, mitochondrial [Zostera marina]